MSDDDADVDRDVLASSAIDAAAMTLRADGGGFAEWIRVEERNGETQALMLLDATYSAGQFDYYWFGGPSA